MCGIAGTWNLPKEFVERMCIHQNSRGPDNIGTKQIGQVVFGHNRLSIVDKSENGNQPMFLADSMIVYNGEVYNYQQFKRGNEISNTDTEIILRDLFYCAHLSEAINRFNGMFSIAFYSHEHEEIILIRDHFGIKPLYYTKQKDFFAFASTPAAVALTKKDWPISEKGLQEYLSLGATMLHSMFEGIEAVPPGHYAVFNCQTQEFHLKRWYYPKFIENAFETIEEKVKTAIDRVKLTCDEPQIILLSGGVDSSLVASRYSGNQAIHLASPEQEYAQQVANRFGIKLNNVHPSNYNTEECLTDYIKQSGDPTMAGLIPYITCAEIKKLGFRVAITANGADELFWGYDRMKSQKEQYEAIFRDFNSKLFNPFCCLSDRHYDEGIGDSQWHEITTYLMFDLNKTLDFASMCHSVEVRVPYLDHELVEACLSIPMDKHIGKYGNKTILKNMLVNLGFDWAFIHRPKVGFSLHYEPNDLQSIKKQAMDWYNTTDYPKLPSNATARQQSYHEMTVLGLNIWHKIYKP